MINRSRVSATSALLLAMLALALSVAAVWASSQPPEPNALDYQLLTNPGVEVFDPPYTQFEGVDCQVATGWQRFWSGEPPPYWMDSRVFAASHLGTGHVEKIEGDTSQLIISTEPYTAGIRQQVSGLTPGVGYGFHAAMLTIYQTSAPPSVHGTMIKQVGMDPTGGTDPKAPTVTWDEADDHDEGPWSIDLRTAAYAQAPTMTVFIRVISPLESGGLPYLNYSILDSAILAETASVAATSPATSEDHTFVVRWDNAVPSPGGELRWYDAEWLDEAEGVWHGWFTRTDRLQASFTGERGHTYRFRAAAWQHYPNGAHLVSPYRPDGDTQTYVRGPELVGRVLTSERHTVRGATVAISGTAQAATTGSDGSFGIRLLPSPDPRTVIVHHPAWLAPAPVYGLTFGTTQTVALTWTLRPLDDALSNGGFEAGLEGWSPIEDQGQAPTLVAEPVHTGRQALALTPVSLTIGLTQTVVLTGAWEPALSFWYHPKTTDAGDRFNVVLAVTRQTVSPTIPLAVSYTFTPTLEAGGWRHAWYYPGPPNAALTGTVTIRFQMWNDGDDQFSTVYVDEVSLGSTPGGPHRVHLPLVLR
jgi:hypothetical protein